MESCQTLRDRRDQNQNNQTQPQPAITSRVSIGTILSIIAFLIAVLPATYNLVNAFRDFMDVLKKEQQRLTLVQQEQSKTLKQIQQTPLQATYSSNIDSDKLSSLQTSIDRLIEFNTVRHLPPVDDVENVPNQNTSNMKMEIINTSPNQTTQQIVTPTQQRTVTTETTTTTTTVPQTTVTQQTTTLQPRQRVYQRQTQTQIQRRGLFFR